MRTRDSPRRRMGHCKECQRSGVDRACLSQALPSSRRRARRFTSCLHRAAWLRTPNASKKGLGQASAEFDTYQLAKYRRQGTFPLVDLVNLVHPPHSEPLAQLVKGTLAPADTWETKLTQAGQGRIRRRCRGEQSRSVGASSSRASLVTLPCCGTCGEHLVRRAASHQRRARNAHGRTPHQAHARAAIPLHDCLRVAEKDHPHGVLRVIAALSDCGGFVIAKRAAVPGQYLRRARRLRFDHGTSDQDRAVFAAVLAKANDADVMLFSDDAKHVALNKRDSTLTLARWLESQCASACK